MLELLALGEIAKIVLFGEFSDKGGDHMRSSGHVEERTRDVMSWQGRGCLAAATL